MAAQSFRVILTQSAWSDLEDIVAYWTERDEPERGEQYAHDLPAEAIQQLSATPAPPKRDAISGIRFSRRRKNCRCSDAPTAFSIW